MVQDDARIDHVDAQNVAAGLYGVGGGTVGRPAQHVGGPDRAILRGFEIDDLRCLAVERDGIPEAAAGVDAMRRDGLDRYRRLF
jgi:hypothetical protein